MKISTDEIATRSHEQVRRQVTSSLNTHSAIVVLMVSMILVSSFPPAHAGGIKVGRNINLSPDISRQVVETDVAVDPRNSSIIVAGAGQGGAGYFPAAYWPRYFRSTDGGLTWSSRLLPGFQGDASPEGLASPLRHLFATGGAIDDTLAFDQSGNLYYSGEGANFTSSGRLVFSSFTAFVAKFANDGADYVRATILPISTSESTPVDFPAVAVDRSGGPNDGNVYESLACCAGSSEFTRSTDGGLSFSTPIGIPGPGSAISITVDPAGNLLVLSVQHSTTGGKSNTWLVAKSTDGGLTFGKSIVLAKVTGIPSPPPGTVDTTGDAPVIRADSSGVYVIGDDSSTGVTNIVFTKSTDGGLSWTGLTQVSDAVTGQRFFPVLAVSGGIISIAWYDSRLGQQLSNGTITGLDVFYAESRDLGSTFSKNVRVTSVSFNPNIVFSSLFHAPFIGDYMGIAASPGAVHAVWADNRNACDTIDPTFGCVDQDVYTATITP